MYAELVQRWMMAAMLTLTLVLWIFGATGWALFFHIFIVAMVALWAATDFCPSLWFLKKVLPSLYRRAE
jgi:hypothetical protein